MKESSKRKMALAHTGLKHSKATRLKISKSLAGQVRGRYTHTPSFIAKSVLMEVYKRTK